jgi:hypothetical protein
MTFASNEVAAPHGRLTEMRLICQRSPRKQKACQATKWRTVSGLTACYRRFLIDISKVWILPVRQVFKRDLLRLLLVQLQRISSKVLATKHHHQCDGQNDHDAVAKGLSDQFFVIL